jgi:hypothetical protein
MTKLEKRYLFNAIMMAHIYKYMEIGIEDIGKSDEIPNIVYRIKQQAYNHTVINRLNSKDAKYIDSLTDDKLREVMSQELSFIMFALHLTKIYTEKTPEEYKRVWNINEKDLRSGTSLWVVPMIQLKKKDEKLYNQYKELIEKSKKIAEFFYDFMYNKLIKKDDDNE